MVSCPNCGARNDETVTHCRLCGNLLEADSARSEEVDSISPTVIVAAQPPAQRRTDPADSRNSVCSTCGTINDPGWSFCQHCGNKIKPDAGDFASHPNAQKMPQDLITVVAEPVRIEQMDRGTPMQPDPSRPRQSNAGVGQPSPATELVHSGSLSEHAAEAVHCPQCGHPNSSGSAFCSQCGSPIPVNETIAMSSVPAPPRGRLRLIMEGGQQGDVYELKDETVVGRTSGDISFPHDGFMSSRHARVVRRGSSFVLVDEGSRNGTFIKIRNEVELKPGDTVLIGKQLFRFEV